MVLATGLLPTCLVCGQENNASSGAALSSIMNVRRAPAAKSMGLFQSSFLEAIAANRRSMQLALVIDSTESMSGELDSIRKNLPNLLTDIHQIMDGALETAIISYADIGAAETPAKILSRDFVSQLDSMKEIVQQIKPNSGKPYFPEAVDLGVYIAINNLAWSADENVEKWILLIGDAPPYDAGFDDPATSAKRWYGTDLLVDLANQRGVKVHCLLCNSRDEEKNAYVKLLGKTQDFMSRLSDGTGGLLLDLSYEHVREKLAENINRPRGEYIRIGHISNYDIDSARGKTEEPGSESNKLVRIGVLPFLPIDSMSFVYSRPEVQIAAEIRKSLDALPDIRTASTQQLERGIARLISEGTPVDELPQALSLLLRLDYVLHGDLTSSRATSSSVMRVFGRNSKSHIFMTTAEGQPSALSAALLGNIRNNPNSNADLRPLRQSLQPLEFDQEGRLKALGMFAGLSEIDRLKLMSAYEALEQGLGYSQVDPLSRSLMDSAEKELVEFLAVNREHAFAHVMLASCLYNQARILEANGQLDAAKTKFQNARDTISHAYSMRTKLIDPIARLEIEGDYQLLVKQDYLAAMDAYQKITAFSVESPIKPALRAHWMLAGIQCGDWQVSKSENADQIVDPDQARTHLIKILAYWPESPEAAMIKQNMLWDEIQNKSRSPYIPRVADTLVSN